MDKFFFTFIVVTVGINIQINAQDWINGTHHSELQFTRFDGLKFATFGQADLNKYNSTFDIQHHNGNDIRFLVNGTEHLRIHSSGEVGIGTISTGSHKLAVEGSIRTQDINLHGTSGMNHSQLIFYRGDGQKFASFGQANLTTANSTFDIQHHNGNDIRFLVNGTEHLRIHSNGEVGIGTISTGSHKLAVEGSIGAREIKVEANGWSDFVFDPKYELRTLEEVESYITKNRHLPDIPSEAEVIKNGINLGEMDAKLLQKIEELTLYTIQQEKKIKNQEERIENLEILNKKLLELQKRLERIENK